MGYRLQMARVGTGNWQTLASQDTAALAVNQSVALACLDSATFANGVYQNPRSICPQHHLMLPRLIRSQVVTGLRRPA